MTQTLTAGQRLSRHASGISDLGDDARDSIINLLSGTFTDGERVTIRFYYANGTVGLNTTYAFNASGLKSGHNGGTIISPTVPWDGVAGSTHTDFLAGTGETDPGGSGVWELQYQGYSYPAWWGASLGTDDTNAVSACLNNGDGVLDASYNCAAMTVAVGFGSTPEGELVWITSSGGTPLTLSGDNQHYGIIRQDFNNNYAFPGLDITGDNNVIEGVVQKAMDSPLGAGTNQGLRTQGINNTIEFLHQDDFTNTGNANGSMPQGWVDIGDNNFIGEIIQKNGRAGVLPNSATGVTKIGTLTQYNMEDNGVYLLNGTLVMDKQIYQGAEEPFVAVGNAVIGELVVIGPAIAGVGLDDAGDVTIDHLHIMPDNAGSSAEVCVRTRSGNSQSGKVVINKITGRLTTGKNVFGISNGLVEYFSVKEMDIVIDYDAAIFNPLSNFMQIDSTQSFDFGRVRVRIIDTNDVLTGSNNFVMENKGFNLTQPSTIDELDVRIFASDETTVSPAVFRGSGFNSGFVVIGPNHQYQTNIGPYIRERRHGWAPGIPTTPANGSWVFGADYPDYNATAAPFRFRCTKSGTYGTYSEGLTATTDGTDTVVLSGATAVLRPGFFVTINATDVMILSISGTTMIVSATIAAGSGLAIAYTTPTFVAY